MLIARRHFALGVLTAVAPLPHALAQRAQALSMLVGFSAGAAPDTIARVVARAMEPTLKRTIVVINVAGVAGQLALEKLKQADSANDAVAITPLAALTIYPSIYASLPYEPSSDFAPVCTVCVTDTALVVAADHPARDVPGFLQWCKAHPDKANIGNPGSGSPADFAIWLLANASSTPLERVPYRAPPQISQEIIGGNLAGGIASSSLFAELVKSGRLRVLATSGVKRSPLFPNAPTFTEVGFTDVVVQDWFALYVRKGAPASTIHALASAARDAAGNPQATAALRALGLTLDVHDAAWLAELMRTERARWQELAVRAKFKLM